MGRTIFLIAATLWMSFQGPIGPANAKSPGQHDRVELQRLADGANLALEVTLNGVRTGEIAEFSVTDGKLFAAGSELQSLGLRADSNKSRIALDEMDLTYSLDWPKQLLHIRAIGRALQTHQIVADDRLPQAGAPKGFGGFITYDAALHTDRSGTQLSSLLDARLYQGAFSAGSRFLINSARATAGVTRLDTALTWSDTARLRRLTLGDAVSGGLVSNRPVRLGGVQFSSAFEQRPGLITSPLPTISGEVAVPSSVDVLVNGLRRASQDVAAGPFYMRRVPVSSGAGTVSVLVRDVLGHVSQSDIQVYVSDRMLEPGLRAYSMEAGFLRTGYGGRASNYREPIMAATGRLGLAAVTLEGHGEASRRIVAATGGAAFQVARSFDVTAGVAVSRSGLGYGKSAYLALERATPVYRVALSAQTRDHRYTDLAAYAGDPLPRLSLTATAGLSLARFGSLSAAYTLAMHEGRAIRADRYGDPARYRLSLATVQYSVSRGRFYLSTSAFHDAHSGANGAAATLSIQLSPRRQLSSSVALRQGERTGSIDVRQSAFTAGDVGWHVYGETGARARLLAEAEYKSPVGDVAASGYLTKRDFQLDLRASGTVVYVGGLLAPSRPVRDSFALVTTDGAAGVSIYQDGRRVGRTGKGGRLVLADLASFNTSSISVDQNSLPIGSTFRVRSQAFVPLQRQGAVLRFPTVRSYSVLATMVDGGGKLIPLGTRARVGDRTLAVGYDGQLFISVSAPDANVSVDLPSGGTCHASVHIVPAMTAGEDFPTLPCVPRFDKTSLMITNR